MALDAPRGHGWRWTLLAALAGFASSFVFTSLLQWPRSAFVAVHATVTGVLVATYVLSRRVSLGTQFRRHWLGGIVVGAILGLILMRQVFSQPGSARPHGLLLVGDLVWYGGVYGVIDAALLTLLPVLCLYGSRNTSELALAGARLRWALVALLGSTVVTAAYHVGFAEFRGLTLLQPLIGNLAITLAYLLTGSPLTAVLAHVLMHVAGVLHGPATTMQLPPHY